MTTANNDEDLVRWLVNPMTLEEVEAEHRVLTVERRPPRTALWSYKGRWDEIKSKMRDGDELWWFFVSVGPRCGGIALVRDGKVIDHITLMKV